MYFQPAAATMSSPSARPIAPVAARCLNALKGMIGNTPLLAIDLSYRGREHRLFVKAEQYNLTGSIKDRMALHVLTRALETGALKPGDMIVEASSGNAGIAFAALGRSLGHPVRIYMPDWMSAERRALIASYGAEIVDVSREEGGFIGSVRMAEELAASRADVFLPRQFANNDNCAAHEKGTGPEIDAQLACLGLSPDAFVAGVGTGGTVMGVGRCLRKRFPGITIHPLEPAESPTLTTGHKVGKHRMQGISDEFIPAIVKLDQLDGIVQVRDGDAILMAQQLSRVLGLGVGISSGANLLGALQLAEQRGRGSAVVTVFADDSKKYLSTDLVREEPGLDGYMTPEIELLGYDAVRC